ncbi:hypothetical protein SSX86_026942 [Deinandra increscens subsp. villosa]|uniref:BRCT domain-containing protein n=1 Tax=Deinandra increscens subsp. villosa TaxID=3103831 RepID=A0AAP0CFT4_9ASTR
MSGSTIQNHQTSPLLRQSQPFTGIRFVLLGFDPIKKSQVSRKLVNGGAVDAGQYCPNCTHVIVDKLVYDDPPCVTARQEGKILVSSLWLDHSFDVGAPVDTTFVIYAPVRDFNGIPGAKSLLICLTGYQREDREDIMTMVDLMGARFSKPLIANKVTHLICYKFEGEKYLLAKKVKNIKLINHQWLEACLKAWEIVPEANYSKSGYELEMEAEAKDSEDEAEGVTTRHNEGKIASPHQSLLSKQQVSNTLSNTIASNLFSNAQETVSVTMKTTSDQFPNSHETKIKHQDTEHVIGATSESFNHYGKTVSSSPANKSFRNEAKTVISASFSMKEPVGTPSPKIEMKSDTSSSKRLNKLNLDDAFDMSSSLVQKVTPYSGPVFCPENEQNASSTKGTMDISRGGFKLKQISQNNDMHSAFPELKKDPPIEMSPAQTPSNISGRKPSSSKGKNVICDVPISKTPPSEIEDLDAEQRPQEEYKETSLTTRSNNRDVDMAENVTQSPCAVSSDLQKSSTLNSDINEQSGGSNPKPVRKKSISKKFSAPKLSKKNTVNQKGSIFLKNTELGIDDENLFKYEQLEKVSSAAKSGIEIEMGIENISENKSLGMDDETEPPDDRDELSKEKYEDGEPKSIADALMEEKAEENVDVLDPSTDINNDHYDLLSIKQKVPVNKSHGNTEDVASETPRTKRSKKNTALSMNEVSNKKSVNKYELVIDNNYGNQDIREEATPNRAKRAHRNVNDLEKSTEVKKADVSNNPEHNNDEGDDDVNAYMDIENVVNKKETPKRNKHAPSKTKKDVSKRTVTDMEESVEVERAEGVCNDPEHNNEDKDNDLPGKDADMYTENVLNKKETKRNKRLPSSSMKDDAKTLKKKGQPTSNQAVKASGFKEVQKEDDDVDAFMDIENVVNKKETPKRTKHAPSKTKKDVSNKTVNDLEESVEVERAEGVCNDPEHNNEDEDNDLSGKDADMDTDNVLNKKETKRNKRPLSMSKKDDVKTLKKKGQPTSNQAVKASDFKEAHKEDVDVDAYMDIENVHENVVNKKETKRSKHAPSKTKKDVSKRTVTDLEESVEVERVEGVCNDLEHNNEDKDNDLSGKDADVDTENVSNKKETKRNKCPSSRSKKDDTKTLKKKGQPTSNQAVKASDFKEAQKENTQINVDDQSARNDPGHKNKEKDNDRADKDADMDTENVLSKKESNKNKRPLSRTKKDDAKTVTKKGKSTSSQAVKTCDLVEAQKEIVQNHVDVQSIGNKHVFKPAKEFPEKNSDKANSDVLKDEPMWFILTGHKLQKTEFQKIIRRLKGRVCRVTHSWSYQATHFIVPDPIKRTEKFFAAAASGRWILKTDYLSASNQAGKFLPEETYEWHKNGLSEDGQINLEAPRKWRLLKEKTGHGAFYGMNIVIYGECISPPLDTLKRAVKAGDGTILATSPPYTRFLNTGIDFAVVSPGMPHVDMWVQEFLKHEIPCVSADYLVEYVCKPGYPLERHVQYDTNVWAERSYNSLKNRLEEEISEPKTPDCDDVACEVCGAHDNGEEMLICGDESGLIGCGVGTHIGCCDPPLESVPENDWFCSKCCKKPNNKKPNNSKNKRGSKKKRFAS